MLNGMLIVAAVLGNALGYQIGKFAGKTIFSPEKHRLIQQKHIDKTQAFFDKHGAKTIILARFIPIVRTFAPTMAGVIGMDFKKFLLHSIYGAVLWVPSMTVSGYVLGSLVPGLARTVDKIVIFIIVLFSAPVVIQYIRMRYFPDKKQQP